MSNSDDRKVFYTSDLSLAAFLMMKGLKLLHGTKLASGKFKFEFDNKDETAKKLSIDYVNSKFCEFDNQIRNLKKIIHNS